MQRAIVGLVVVAALAIGGFVALRKHSSPPRWELVDRYCVGCHNETELAGGLAFEDVDANDVENDAAVWEAVVRKLRTGLMPPRGEPRPERGVLDGLAEELEDELDAAAAAAPNPGAKPLARLNRTEYANAIYDVLAFDASAIAGTLPPDTAVHGFDNIATALSLSPTLLEGYALAAMQIGRRAVGDRTMGHGETRYAAAGGAAQRRHIEGLPLGTRGAGSGSPSPDGAGVGGGGGRRRSRSRSSTLSSAFLRISLVRSRRTMSIADSTRSRMIESTSRPT
jgi:hypothetical protein